ncbi:hypothetical protein AZE42_02347 [Rhizopogon vesiculosus]|uniref:Uncharacterized protein n=1 Tax=Rhizopogon vesiculosus TaxID=180088 RepID=A0A1J8QK27_9AGAM|nr:hypothetical protein AZE42_02347 [Rhizopogon vesiculosus]
MQQHRRTEERPRQAHAVNPCMRLFSEIMDSDNASQGFLNSSSMDHPTSPYNIFDYSNNHPSPELLEHSPSHGSAQVQLHPDSGVMRASLPDGTAIFVANGMDVALGQAIRICDRQWDIPVANANAMYDQMGRAEYLVNISASSTSYADPRSSTSETCELTLSGRVPFGFGAVLKTATPKHEIFRDGGRTKSSTTTPSSSSLFSLFSSSLLKTTPSSVTAKVSSDLT